MISFFYVLIYTLIYVETSVYEVYPYYSLAISFTAYAMYKWELYGLIHALLVALILGMSGSSIEYEVLFFVVYAMIIYTIYRHLVYNKLNLLIISALQVFLYIAYVYFFKIREVFILSWIKEFFFIVFYNYIFYGFEKNTGRQV